MLSSLSLPVIKLGSSANSTGAMSAAQMGTRLLLTVSLTQLAITARLVMAQSAYAPLSPPLYAPYSSPPAPPTGSPPTGSPMSPPGSSPVSVAKGGKGGSHNMGAIVGGVLAGVFVTILVTLAVLWCCLRKKRERAGRANADKAPLPTIAQTPPRTLSDVVEGLGAKVPVVSQTEAWPAPKGITISPPLRMEKADVAPQQDMAYNMDVRSYSYAEVEAISTNWKYKLGEGGFGTVYYGEIFSDTSPNADPQKVALKRLSATSQQGKNAFLNEVRLLSRIHFRYLVPLVGFCDEINNQVLIYEYVQEGSLADWLHGAQRGHPDFNWYNRLLIALHAALGLEYLHVGARPNIIHRDVKSSNILITREWEGRVADFGLSKTSGINDKDQQRTHMTTLVKGTPGYLDPEYFRTAQLTTKSDVYSFGIVLLELVTGHLPIDYSEENPQLRCIESYVQSHYPNNLATIADPSLKGNYDMRSMQKIAQVALRSVALQGISRPTMSDVVVEIRSAMKLMEAGGDKAKTNTQDVFLAEILARPAIEDATVPAIRTPHAFAPDQPRSRPGSSTSISRSTGYSSATSVPSSVAFPR